MHKKIDDGFDGLVSDLQKTLSYQTEASGYDPGCGASFRETYDGGTGRFPRYGQKLWIHYQEYRQYGGIYRYVGRCISSSIWTDVPSGRRSCRRPGEMDSSSLWWSTGKRTDLRTGQSGRQRPGGRGPSCHEGGTGFTKFEEPFPSDWSGWMRKRELSAA